jgi:hypothetical protein
MLVRVSTLLDCPPSKAWQEVQTSKLLDYVVSPLVKFIPVQPSQFPLVWMDGKYLVRLMLLGVIPFGRHWIVISRPTPMGGSENQINELLDDGYGDIISKWQHLISIQATSDGRTRYTDTIEIAAGVLTLGVWLYANLFYRHRQRRWRKLVQGDFKYA